MLNRTVLCGSSRNALTETDSWSVNSGHTGPFIQPAPETTAPVQAGPGHTWLFGGEVGGGGSLPLSWLDEVSLIVSEKGICLYLKKKKTEKAPKAKAR